MLGGLKYGSAKKANIYGIVIEDSDNSDEEPFTIDEFMSFMDYILKNFTFKPYKTVFNLSLGGIIEYSEKETLNYLENIFNKFNDMNVIVVAGAGNDNISVVNEEGVFIPCTFDSVICVGAIDNAGVNGYTEDEISLFLLFLYPNYNVMNEQNYRRADFSNYGEQVDIFGPGYATFELYISNYIDISDPEYSNFGIEKNTYMKISSAGTSLSSPIVAGVVATIMSDHPEIKYNKTSMLSYLQEIGEKDIIEDSRGPNIFINNGKHSLYLRDIDSEFITDGIIDDGTELEPSIIPNDDIISDDESNDIEIEVESEIGIISDNDSEDDVEL